MSRFRGDRGSSDGGSLAGLLVLLVLVLVLGAGCGAVKAAHRVDKTITVDSKERVVSGKSGRYLVFTEGSGTYEVTDSLWAGRWDSSDVYGQIEEGVTYDVTVQGYRVPFFSMYPNIIEIEEAPAP